MSDRHALCAAAIRQYGSDPDGVERAMLAAGYSPVTAAASKYVYADVLRKAGHDVDGLAGLDPVVDDLPVSGEGDEEMIAAEVAAATAPPEPARADTKRKRGKTR